MSAVIQRSLSGGELDPVLWARADVTKYQTGLRTLRNALVRRNGGAQGRGGSAVAQATKISGNTVRLIPFIYSQTVTYCMEFGDKYIRFYQNGEPYLAQGISAYNSGTAYSLGDLVSSGGTNYFCCYSGGPGTGGIGFILQNPLLLGSTFAAQGYTATNLTPSTHTGAWYPISGTTYEIPSPWAYSDLPNLRFDQTGNDVVITHPSYPQMRLTRSQIGGVDSFWLFRIEISNNMLPASPTNNQGDSNTLNVTISPVAATCYFVSAVSASGDTRAQAGTNLDVLVGIDITTTNTVPSVTPVTISWSAVPNAVSYNIYYLDKNSFVFGFIGSTTNTTFKDTGITPDYSNPLVIWNQLFKATPTGSYPSCCAFYQQRAFYGNTNNFPTTVWGSQTGLFDNFDINVPSVATDSLQFKMAGQQDFIQHLLSLGTLLVFTYGSINSVQGDQSGAISPSAINPHRETVHGASALRPLIVGEFALYGQSQGSIIRDLGFNFQVDGYRGDDLTVFATHLFDNYTIVDWAYQSIPHSVVWAVRSDGTLLSLTYVREQQIIAWAHHDTAVGFYENVCCIPEGNQVSVYVVANRLINGTVTRFVERLYSQNFTDVRDYIGMDCSTTVDGRNTTTDTVTVTGGTNWNEVELLTVTLSGNNFLTFTSAMATNQDMIFLYDSGGNLYRFKITAYSSATVVQGFIDRSLPVSLQGAATSSWSHAISIVSGLGYLQGQNVSVFADGFVVGSPNNPSYPVYTVNGSGQITLDKPYAVIQVGLPFITDIETLDIDTPGAMENLGGRDKFTGEVTIYTVNSRSLFVGTQNPDTDLTNSPYSPVYRLTEQKLRQFENYDNPLSLQTGKNTQTIAGQWDQNGHIFIRNVDPTPLLVSAISPEGLYPMRAG